MVNMEKKEQTFFYFALGITLVILIIALLFKSDPENKIFSPAERGLSLYKKGEYQEAITYFAQADSVNIPEGSFALGAMHFAGLGTDVDIPKAIKYYEKAAELNYTPAQTTLAILYMQGEVVEKNPEKAVKWAETAARNGDMEAQLLVAGWYENGKNIEQNIKKAVHFYEMAAKQGSADAKIALSVIYKTGKGKILENIYTAKRWEDSIKKQKDFENIFQNRSLDKLETTP